jgi:hypothetical protein
VPAVLGALLVVATWAAPAAAQGAAAVPPTQSQAADTAAPAPAATPQVADTAAPAATQQAADTAALPPVAQTGPGAGTELVVFHATFGPGDAVWENFGHNAIWIHDTATGSTTSYNYGMFDFGQQGFVPRLMRGDMLYSMGVRDADHELAAYSWYNRSVWLQRLDMTPRQRHALREFLEWNWLPENREYLYDYFRDNCSTRIRDALNHALGGALDAALTGVPTGTTYRSHSLRLTAASLPTYTGLILGLGLPTDRPIDAWEESFIPMELMRHLRSVQVTGEDGVARPLVAEERTLFLADRAPPRDQPPSRTTGYLLAGMLLGVGFVALGRGARRSRRATIALAAAISVWGLVTGFFGLILFLLWTATNHVASYANMNLLHVSPASVVVAVAAPLALVRRLGTGRQYAWARVAWPAAIAVAAMSGAGVLMNLLPQLQQDNWPLVALVLPVHIAIVLALYHATPRTSSPREDGGSRIELQSAG